MFIVNQRGRVVGLPEHMEESGFRQAKEVLSISRELMEGGEYIRTAGNRIVRSQSGKNLRDQILAKFPNVVTDEEYLESIEPRTVVKPVLADIENPVNQSEVGESMTKEQIISAAEQNGVKLSNKDKRLSKAKLIELINARP